MSGSGRAGRATARREMQLSVRIDVSRVEAPASDGPPPAVRPETPRRPVNAPTPARRPVGPGKSAANSEPPSRVVKPLLYLTSVLLVVNSIGLFYYLMPIGERVRSQLHPWLRPSGYVGQTAGIVAFAFFIALYLYPVRRRFRWLRFLGGLKRWLDVHIVLGITVLLVAAIHAAWRFRGLIGLGFWAMALVALSGIVGRYLYNRVPRGRSGVELSLDEIEQQRQELSVRIARAARLPVENVETTLGASFPAASASGILSAIRALIAAELARRRMTWRLQRRLLRAASDGQELDKASIRETVRLARRQITLTQQLRMLEASHRVFRFWHVVHRPVAVAAFVAVTIHVVVTVALGVTWFY